MREPDKGPLGTERPGQDFPAPIDFPNECAGTNPDIVEERIAEFTVIHSLDWVAADAGRVRPDDKHADAGMRLCGRIRPRGEPHVVAPICRGPNLFTIDDLIVTIPDGFRSQGREIRAGIRFAVPHAVDAFATTDLGQIPLLLFRSAVDHPGSGLDPHARIGLVAGDGEAAIWPLLVGISRVKEILMRGSLIEGKEAERIGLVNYAVPAEEVLPKATEITQELADGATWAIRWTKLSVNRILKQNMYIILDASMSLEHETMHLQDHRVATRAFVEKRKPKFTGK